MVPLAGLTTAFLWTLVFCSTEHKHLQRLSKHTHEGREELRSILNIVILLYLLGPSVVRGDFFTKELYFTSSQWPRASWALWSLLFYNVADSIWMSVNGMFKTRWKIHHSLACAGVGCLLITRAFPQMLPICVLFELTSLIYNLRSLAKKGLVPGIDTPARFQVFHQCYVTCYVIARLAASFISQYLLWYELYPSVTSVSSTGLTVAFWVIVVVVEGLVLFSLAAIASMMFPSLENDQGLSTRRIVPIDMQVTVREEVWEPGKEDPVHRPLFRNAQWLALRALLYPPPRSPIKDQDLLAAARIFCASHLKQLVATLTIQSAPPFWANLVPAADKWIQEHCSDPTAVVELRSFVCAPEYRQRSATRTSKKPQVALILLQKVIKQLQSEGKQYVLFYCPPSMLDYYERHLTKVMRIGDANGFVYCVACLQ